MKDDAHNGNSETVRGGRRKRLLSEAIQLEEEVVPEFIKPALLAVAALVVLFVGWSAVVVIKEIASAPGIVVPSASVKVVEHLEGGIITEILVEDGSEVEEGQLLARMDTGQGDAELKQMQARQVALSVRGERLLAFLENREPDFSESVAEYPKLISDQEEILKSQIASQETSRSVIESQIQQRKRELIQLRKSLTVAKQQQNLTTELLEMRTRMMESKLVSKVEFLETKRAKVTADGEISRIKDDMTVNQLAIQESENNLDNLDAELRQAVSQEMGTISAELEEVKNSIARIQDRVDRLEVRAPTHGIVQDLQIRTVGQVVQPAGLMMQIVPLGDVLEVEVQIASTDFGHVKQGQSVLVKVSSFEYSRFGGVEGELVKLAATSTLDPNGLAVFKGWVSLSKPYVGKQEGRYKILPGMDVQADITTGEKTFLQYLLKPLTDAMGEAFTER
jgi:membrane fusion protein, adhesin transport system